MKKLIWFFSIVTILFPLSSNSLDLLLSIEKLKFFIFPDHIGHLILILLYWTLVVLEVLFFILRRFDNTWSYFLIESFCSGITSSIMPTKLCQLSKRQKCLKIQHMDFPLIRNDFFFFFTEYTFFLLFYIVLHYSITIKHHFPIL